MSFAHLELDSPPDPARVMEMFNTFPDDVREGIMEKVMGRFQADPLGQDVIRTNWEKVKDDFGKDGEATKMMHERRYHHITTTQSWDVKPDSPSSALKTLIPIQISDMELGQTHRGRFLVGAIADTDGFWTINSGVFLLQDFSGSVIEVAVYNSPRTKFSREFHLGREICISEPFLKIRADGTAGIRVDRPAEIISYALPHTSEEWKEFGNSCIKQCPRMALTCYEKSLQAPDKQVMELIVGGKSKSVSNAKGVGKVPPNVSGKAKRRNKKQRKKFEANKEEESKGDATKVIQDAVGSKIEVSKVLTNISLCQASMGDFDSSLLYALLAFGLGVDRWKAAFRVAKALDLSGLKKEAKDFSSWYCSAYELDTKSNKSSTFRKEFKIDAGISGEGASWVKGDTLERLVEASSRVKEAPASLLASIKSRSTEKDFPLLLAKQYGNDSFHENNLPKAVQYYVAALSLCPFAESVLRDTSFVVSNKGAAWLGILGDDKQASSGSNAEMLIVEGVVSMLSAALMNPNDNGRAWVRVSRFLGRQGRHEESLSFLEVVKSLLAKQAFTLSFYHAKEPQPPRALALVQSELLDWQQRSSSRAKVEKVSDVSTKEQLRQRKAEGPDHFSTAGAGRKKLDDDILEYEQGYNMQSMREMMLNDNSKVGQIRTLAGPTKDRRLDDYSAEFVKGRGIPEGLDNVYARKVLYRSFVADRMHPWFRVMGWRMAWGEDENNAGSLKRNLMSDEDLFKRWHSTAALSLVSEHPEKYARPGAIVDIRKMKPKSHSSYDSRIRSNFVNCPSRVETLHEGTTHLAIGFNDLNSLMNCKWKKPQGGDHRGQPAHFVGLEMNAFNVAKTVVIAEMLSNQSVPLGSVLEVWFSTVWSRSTLTNFNRCVKAVLGKGEEDLAPHRVREGGFFGSEGFAAKNVSNSTVASYLHHWLSAEPLSFKEARRKWLDNTVEQNIKIFHSISSCKRKEDRLALGHYFLTGEVFANPDFCPNGLNAVGSLPFWCCPGRGIAAARGRLDLQRISPRRSDGDLCRERKQRFGTSV